jgi:2-polyprenyl-3-methyl-5-hydroxy-6-metoxy-1,4-benzoquinol methylase
MSDKNNPEHLEPYDPRKYWENRLKTRFDVVGVGHPSFTTRYNEFLYKLQLIVLKEALRMHNISLSGKKVLDIGCGTGIFSKFYLKNSAQITGIDITTTSVESLRQSLPEGKFITMDISAELSGNKEYFEKQFDIINMFNVIFHIVDDPKFEKVLENLVTCLKDGGYLIISDYFDDHDFMPASSTKFRSLDRYRTLEQKGVTIVDIIPMYFLMNRRFDNLSFELNSLISPLLFIADYIIAKLKWPKAKNMKLMIGSKRY